MNWIACIQCNIFYLWSNENVLTRYPIIKPFDLPLHHVFMVNGYWRVLGFKLITYVINRPVFYSIFREEASSKSSPGSIDEGLGVTRSIHSSTVKIYRTPFVICLEYQTVVLPLCVTNILSTFDYQFLYCECVFLLSGLCHLTAALVLLNGTVQKMLIL